jgi:hypothetical protein
MHHSDRPRCDLRPLVLCTDIHMRPGDDRKLRILIISDALKHAPLADGLVQVTLWKKVLWTGN